MNILGICTTYAPLMGGSETHCIKLFEGLARLGHQVTVITNSPIESLEQEVLNGVNVIRTNKFVDSIKSPTTVAWEEAFFGPLKQIKRLLKKQTFDLIHTHNQASLILGSLVKSELNCPLVASFHETNPELEPFGKARSSLIFTAFPYDMIIAGSNYFYQQAIAFGAQPDKVRVIRYGVERKVPETLLTKTEARHYLSIPQSAYCLTCIARFTPRKQQLLLVQSLKNLFLKFPDLHCCLAGSCNSGSEDYLQEIIELVKLENLSQRVSIFRDASDSELGKLLIASDLGTLVSKQEGLGFALLEYMQAKLPVFGTRVSGITEVIQHEVNGLLIDQLNEANCEDVINRLRNEANLETRLVENGTNTCQKYSNEKMINEIESFYDFVIDQKSQSRTKN